MKRRGWLIAVVLLLVLLLLGWWGLRKLARPQVSNVLALQPEARQQERLSTRLLDVQGDWLRLDVVSDQVIDQGSYSKSSSDVLRNRRFVNTATGEQRSLFPGLGQLLMAPRDLRESDDEVASHSNRSGAVYATLYRVVDRDSNGDGRLSRQDASQLIITRPDGRDAVTLYSLAQAASGVSQDWRDAMVLRRGDALFLQSAPDAQGASTIVRFDVRSWKLQTPWPVPAPQ